MSDQIFAIPAAIANRAHVTVEQHGDWTERARTDPDGFWAEQAKRVSWMKAPTKVLSGGFTGDVRIKWDQDGTLNASAACLDRHLQERGTRSRSSGRATTRPPRGRHLP